MRRFLMTAVLVGLTAGAAARGGAEPSKEVKAVANGNNDFAFRLYDRLRLEEGNLFFSPTSLSTALAMTFAGARGPTADEMAQALAFPQRDERLHRAYAALLAGWKGEGKKRGYELSVANALWGQKGYDFRADFLKLTRDRYGADLRPVDFVANTEEARKTINAWAEEETRGKIKDVLKEGVLNSLTRLVLTNAIYFKGDWASQFKKDLTREEPFHVAAGRQVKVPMMQQAHSFGYAERDTLQILEMPYEGKELSMVVLLPKKGRPLADLEKGLSAAKVEGWLTGLRPRDVVVQLPRFKTTSEFGLKKELSALGMSRAFGTASDLSGIGGDPGELYLADVVHKAFVDVNEQGTEAAAVTGAVVAVRSAPVRPVFRADRPFVFLIRDRNSGAVMFLGRVTNPA